MDWKRLMNGVGFAFEGLWYFFKSEPNGRIQLAVAMIVIVLGFVVGVSSMEWVAITLVITSVLAFEMINTALERLADLVSPETHPLIKQAKDVSAAAVLVSAVSAVVIGTVIFLPRILN